MYFAAILLRLETEPVLEAAAGGALGHRHRRSRRPQAGARNPRWGIWRRSPAAGGTSPRTGMMTANSTSSAAILAQLAVGLVGAGGQQVVEQHAKLGLAPAAARLHVGEDAAEIADLRGGRLHVAHRLLHGGELVEHALEARLHLLLDRLVQLLIDGASGSRRGAPRCSRRSRAAWSRASARASPCSRTSERFRPAKAVRSSVPTVSNRAVTARSLAAR